MNHSIVIHVILPGVQASSCSCLTLILPEAARKAAHHAAELACVSPGKSVAVFGAGQTIETNGRPVGTRTPDLYRGNLELFVFTITYKSAGTAKIRGSRARNRMLWVEILAC
jgi:hypothetical protein